MSYICPSRVFLYRYSVLKNHGPSYSFPLYTGPCPPGMEAHTAVCQPCPVGKYRDSLELTGCLDCPVGMSTIGTHSTNQSQCIGE